MRQLRNLSLLLPCFALALSSDAAKSADKSKEPRPTKEEAAKKEFLKNRTNKAEEKKASPKTPAKPPAPKEEKAEKAEKEAVPSVAQKPPPKLSLPLVKGQTSKGVVFPYNDGSGKKTMNFRIGTATPVDDDHIKMSDLTIETLDEAGEPELTIDLPASVLDLKTRVLSGNERVTIKRKDFEITGATMQFNTETRQGKIDGDVKMIIYDLSEELPATAPQSERESP